jgi:hypothetical protein
MKRIAAAIALALALAASEAHAAGFGLAKAGDAWALFLNGDASLFGNDAKLNGQFDTIDFLFQMHSGLQLTNISSGLNAGVPRLPGEPFTFRNRALDQDPLDGGLGWNVLAPTPAITPSTIQWAGGPLGGTIDTRVGHKGGWLFLANFYFSPPVDAELPIGGRIQLISGGNVVMEIPKLLIDMTIPLPEVPEPAAGVLGWSLFAALAAARPWPRNRR